MDNSDLIHPVILAGGSGTRLWPLSRRSYPKQFSTLMGEQSLFQATADRLNGEGFAPPLVLTGEEFRFIVTEQLAARKISPRAVFIEPEPRNTAPAILAAALWLEKTSPSALMLVAPSDHVIADAAAFRAAVTAACDKAREGYLVTFGIHPERPETGYGYLELAKGAGAGAEQPQPLARFVEKPDADRAKVMIEAGNFLWNAGIFLFSVQAILEAFRQYQPEMVAGVAQAVEEAQADLGFTRLDAKAWAGVPSDSIDYAIMEKAGKLAVMPYAAGWSDLGSWEAVWQESGPDEAGNVCSQGASAIDCQNTLLRSESDGLELVGIGLEDVIAVAMPDAVLVARKSEAQRVKDAVERLKAKPVKQAVEFPREHRPWGWFESLAIDGRFQVKRIVVNPGAALSLQSHHHRSEHWVVVAGTAKVTIDKDVKLVSENQSVYIPLGAVHRLENPGKLPMVLIEIQTGSYLGEDDIIRYEDVYSRK